MNEPKVTGVKICSDCNKTLPVLAFSSHKEAHDGLRSNCRDCVQKYNKRYRAERKIKNNPSNGNFLQLERD